MELNKKNIKRILLIVFISIIFFWGLNHTSVLLDFLGNVAALLSPFIIGLCIAFVTNVLLRFIEGLWNKIPDKKGTRWLIKIKRPVCLLLSILLILGVIFILLFMIIPQISDTVESIVGMLPQFFRQVEIWWTELSAFLENYSIVLPHFELDFNGIINKITDIASEVAPSVIDTTVSFTGSLFSGIFNLVLGFAFSIYILAQKEKHVRNTKKMMKAFLPDCIMERTVEICSLSNRAFSNFVTGQLTEAAIIGVLCLIGMSIFGMPYAPVISLLIGFTALIPIFGAFIGTAIGAFLILMVSPIKAFWFVIFIIVLQQLEGNLIYPKVVGKSVGLPGIWVLTAVTIGGGIFGVAGMLISVPIFSVLYVLLKQCVNSRLKKKSSAESEEAEPIE